MDQLILALTVPQFEEALKVSPMKELHLWFLLQRQREHTLWVIPCELHVGAPLDQTELPQ